LANPHNIGNTITFVATLGLAQAYVLILLTPLSPILLVDVELRISSEEKAFKEIVLQRKQFR